MVFCKEFEQNSLTVAYFWSRLLSDTFKNKPPFICELAAVSLFLLSNKYLIGSRMITIWSDNLVTCAILKRRLTEVDTFDNPIVNRLLLGIANIPFQVHYVSTKANVSDVISRHCAKNAQSYDEILNSSVSISDLGVVDDDTYNPDVSIQDYLKRSKQLANSVKKMASESFDRNELRSRFTLKKILRRVPTGF